MRRKYSITAFLMALISAAIPAHGSEVGDQAPLFTAESTAGKISLNDYIGNNHVVLAFYYADFTPVGTLEMQTFQGDLEKFKSRNTHVLGVSPDTIETHERFRGKYGITFPLISDTAGALRKIYSGGRITFLIDRDGIIRLIQKGVPDNGKILEEIDKLND